MQYQPVIDAQNGPLPLQSSFNADSDLTMILFVSGSAWTTNPGTWAGCEVLLDGTTLGTVAVYCNEAESHRALISTLFPINVGFGEHTISLSPLGGTSTDVNDYFNAILIY
jgi:hypothetical protein